MKLKWMKAVTVVMSAAMLASCFVGCGDDSEGNGPVDVNVGKLGPYETPIDVESAASYYITTSIPEGEERDDNVWTRLYKDMGINVTFKFTAPNVQYTEKLNTDIAIGSIPDIVTVDTNQLVKLMRADLIYDDLAPYFEKYATEDTIRVTGGLDSEAFKVSTVDGKLVGIPYTDNGYDAAEIMYIRKDWLDKFNLDPPETIEELEVVLDKFVNEDPDGNGVDDTFGLPGNKELYGGGASFAGIFYAYGAFPHTWVEQPDGSIMYGGLTEQMKAPLKKLNEWYQKGYIVEDFAIQDMQKAGSAVMSSEAGVWFGNMTNPGWPLMTTVANDYNADWYCLPVPTATDSPASTAIYTTPQKFHVVRKGYEHPEALILMMNAFVDKMWGSDLTDPAEHNKYAEMSSFALCQAWPTTKNLDAFHNIQYAIDNNDTSKLNAEETLYYNNVKAFLDRGSKITDPSQQLDWARTRIFYTGGSQDVIDYYVTNNLVMDDLWKYLDTPAMSMKKRSMEVSARELATKIIMGQIPVDDFDKQVEAILKAGGQQVVDEANEVYKENQ